MNTLRAVVSTLALSLPLAVAHAESALEQLQRANSGNQTTGKTFDNSNRAQPSDARPSGRTTTIETPRSSSTTTGGYSGSTSSGTYSGSTSSGTAGGYSVGNSSGTASGSRPVRRGSESTK